MTTGDPYSASQGGLLRTGYESIGRARQRRRAGRRVLGPELVTDLAAVRERVFHTGLRVGSDVVVHNSVLTWANAITATRLLLLPVIVRLILNGSAPVLTFALCWLVVVADAMDGFVARRLNQVSKIGAAIDPIVDAVTVLALLIALAVGHALSWWVVAAVLLRDAGLLVLQLSLWMRCRQPQPAGKLARAAGAAILLGLPGLIAAGGLAHTISAAAVYLGIAAHYVAPVMLILNGRRVVS